MTMLAFALISVFPALMLASALKDVASMTIPNWLTGALALAFLPASFAIGAPIPTIGLHLAIGMAGLAFGVGLFAAGWLGGGDAKLLAAGALWLGWPDTAAFLLWTAIGGGVLAVVLLSARKLAPAFSVRGPAWAGRLLEPKGDVPYGVAIAFGALMVFPQSSVAAGFFTVG